MAKIKLQLRSDLLINHNSVRSYSIRNIIFSSNTLYTPLPLYHAWFYRFIFPLIILINYTKRKTCERLETDIAAKLNATDFARTVNNKT